MTVLMPSWYYEKKDLKRSPSIQDGIDTERESRYRREGARFIINVGTKMGLRYDTMATGVVYFHRFYMFHSFRTFPRYVTACCCLFLAGKVEETPKKCKDIIRIARTFLTESQFAQFGDDPKEEVMTLERILLQTIKFDLQVDHPYGHLLKYAKSLKGDKEKLEKMVQMAWTFINDSFCTTLCLQWEPEIIAIALMYLAGKLSKFEVVDWKGRTPKHNCWWDMFVEGMSIELLEDICHQALDLYSTPIPNTPQDSPPATPPTKSTRKVQPPAPVPMATSPVPQKAKEVPVGQPIPRLEPGELKRKALKPPSRKDSGESKVTRPSTAPHTKNAPAAISPKPSTEPEVKKASPNVSLDNNKQSQKIQTVDSSYRSSKVQYSQPAVTSVEPSKQTVSAPVNTVPGYSATPQTAGSQYLPYGQPLPQYYSNGTQQQPPVQQTMFSQPPRFPTPSAGITAPPPSASHSSQAQAAAPQFAEMYPSQPLPSTHAPPPPPQYAIPAASAGAAQFQPPAVHPSGPVVLPSSSLPPPASTSNISQPTILSMNPGFSSMPSNLRPDMTRLPHASNIPPPPPPGAAPPPAMPPGMLQTAQHMVLHESGPVPPMPAPPHYGSRAESNIYSDSRSNADHRSNMIAENRVPRGLPPYMHDDYRGHYEHDRPPAYFRNKRNDDFAHEHYLDDEYNRSYGPEYENSMLGPPPRRYSLEHHAQRKYERGPPPSMMKSTRPEMPTGIPPVRITGSPFPPGGIFRR